MSSREPSEFTEATSVACVRSNTVLLVRRAYPPSEGLWSFPGGKVMPGEPLEEAARRELKEETSLHAVELRCWKTSFPISEEGKAQYRIHVFTCHHVEGEAVAASDAAELGWFTLKDALNLPLAPSMRDFLEILFQGK